MLWKGLFFENLLASNKAIVMHFLITFLEDNKSNYF